MTALINSAAYVNAEMAAEFGSLPPALLPLGTQRLIEHQVAAIGPDAGAVHLSLPDSFVLEAADRALLDGLGVTVIRVPDDISLGRSVFHCLQCLPDDEPLAMLHGDTLLSPPRIGTGDAWAVAGNHDGYRWGYAEVHDGRVRHAKLLHDGDAVGKSDHVLCGYFGISDVVALRAALMDAEYEFIGALSTYAARRPVDALEASLWWDFGHLQTYYRSRSAFASARVFNRLRIGHGVVRKSSDSSIKIAAEAAWYKALPPGLAPYSARLVASGGSGPGFWYSTEYEYLPTLQELHVFGRLGRQAWQGILESCVECLEAFAAEPADGPGPALLQRLSVSKTAQRMDAFEANSNRDLGKPGRLNGHAVPPIRRIAEEMFAVIAGAETLPACVMHGDFCFSNILFNARTRRVRLIDPRGTYDDQTITNAGDFRYDMAKLAHSVFGFYDLIVAARYRLEVRDGARLDMDFDVPRTPAQEAVAAALGRLRVAGVPFDAPLIGAVMITLFIAMLPLHAESARRQFAFMANVQRLYLSIFGARA